MKVIPKFQNSGKVPEISGTFLFRLPDGSLTKKFNSKEEAEAWYKENRKSNWKIDKSTTTKEGVELVVDENYNPNKAYNFSASLSTLDRNQRATTRFEQAARDAGEQANLYGNSLYGFMGSSLAAAPLAYGASVAIPLALPTLQSFGSLMLPSTWIEGVSSAAGYTAPKWLSLGSDLALSEYFAALAGREIDKNGLNLRTGTNAALSLLPLTRDANGINMVYNTIKRPLQSVTSVVDDFRAFRNMFSSPAANLAREFRNSIKNTEFVNVPIEHVSSNGITETLNSFSPNDVGFHFSYAGSPTSYNIQRATGAPFVRTGTFTYTNNTQPIFVLDKGNWTYKYNPEIYRGVNPGTTTAENALALSLKGPNYVYVNNYEGNGVLSLMTVNPSQVVLSKNEAARLITPIKTDTLISSPYESYLTNIITFPDKQQVGGLIGNDIVAIIDNNIRIVTADGNVIDKSFNNQNDLLNFLSEYHLNYVDNLDPVTRLLHLNSKAAPEGRDINGERLYVTNPEYLEAVKLATLDDIDLFYGSNEYRNRFLKQVKDYYDAKGYSPFSEDFAAEDYLRYLNSLKRVLSKYIPVMTGDKSIYGYSNTDTNILGLSTDAPTDIPNTITHEFGHLTYSDLLHELDSPINVWEANDVLFGNPYSKFLPDALKNKSLKLLNYYSNTNELRLLLIPAVKEMFENGWTPEIAYEKANLGYLKDYFPKDYLVKILGGLLATIPFAVNDKNS